jgi:hypothetical protein
MPFGFLFSWWKRRRPAQRGYLHLRMYTRRGCHLCEVAWQQLEAAQQRHGFRLDAVDVDTDPELTARYGGAVNDVLLQRLLRAEADHPSDQSA